MSKGLLAVFSESFKEMLLLLSCRRAVITLLQKKKKETCWRSKTGVLYLCSAQTTRSYKIYANRRRGKKSIDPPGPDILYAWQIHSRQCVLKKLGAIVKNVGSMSYARVNWLKGEALAAGRWRGDLPSPPGGWHGRVMVFKYLGVHVGDESTIHKNWEGMLE